MEDIAFFDLKVTLQPKVRIGSMGVYYKGRSRHTTSLHDFEIFTQEATFLCGYNILAHDLPYLARAGVSAAFLQRNFIDTLFLSPLLFPNRPYHHLVKDYQLLSEHFNDPVEDSKLSRDLLADCVGAFHSLPLDLQYIFYHLLKGEQELKAFFQLFFMAAPATTPAAPYFLRHSLNAAWYK